MGLYKLPDQCSVCVILVFYSFLNYMIYNNITHSKTPAMNQ